MIALVLMLALVGQSAQSRLETVLKAKAVEAASCTGGLTERSAPFCWPAKVTISGADAARALDLILAVDADIVPCQLGDPAACFRQAATVKTLRQLGWCHTVGPTQTGATAILWARCEALPPPP